MLRKIQLAYLFRYIGDALFYPFMNLYLISRAIEGDDLGLILGVLPLIAIVANIFFSLVKFNHKYDKLLLSFMLLLEGLLIFIYGFNLTFGLFLLLTIFIGFLNAPYYALLDSYTTKNFITSEEYPRVRVMGSIAYIIGGVLGGFLIDYIGYFYLFLIAFITYVISFLFMLSLKKKISVTDDEVEEKSNIKEVFNYGYIIYVIFYVLILGSNNIFDTYFNVFLQDLNYDIKIIGIINSLVIVSETIMMYVMIVVLKHKINLRYFLAFCGFTLFLKDFLFVFDLPNYLLIIISMLRGVGWGGILSVNVLILSKLCKKRNLTIGLLLLYTTVGLFRAVSTYIAGDLYLEVGFSPIFFVVAMIQLAGIILILLSRKFGEMLKNE